MLTGSEIKSVRAGRVDLADGYARPENGELWLVNVHIAPYGAASTYNHEPRRPRKLLLHRAQIAELTSAVAQKGLTLVASASTSRITLPRWSWDWLAANANTTNAGRSGSGNWT